MAEQQAIPPDDLRRDVRRALESNRVESLTKACKFVGGLAAICVAVGSGVAALGQFSAIWFVALVMITASGGTLAYVVNELSRLSRHSQLLRELLQSEKYYENLLRSAREEREIAEQSARHLQGRFDVIVGMKELLRAELRELSFEKARKSLPPDSGDQNG